MQFTLGIDVGSTYTKAVIVDQEYNMLARYVCPTGHKLKEVADKVTKEVLKLVGKTMDEISYTISTGSGRHQVDFRDLQVTDLTAASRGANHLFPDTRTVLDIGGQTMKVSKVDEHSKVLNFRLNDKCASGTGAFLEKTAKYMGYSTQEIGSLLNLAKNEVPISGVCAVFAESEVISHLSEGVPPEDIMYGSILSLTKRCVQLMRRAKSGPGYTLAGGILRWEKMADVIKDEIQHDVNVPPGDLPQFIGALGCAILGHVRLRKLGMAA
ncbi:MAG: hypothetical protein GY781_11465 [Gammaproteobacteria bacterium]|nr:hypothetical protein [Gammaproteobacteria bacterium]